MGSTTITKPDGSKAWEQCEVQTIVLNPVTGGSPENDAFFANTPSGEIKLGTINAAAAAEFELNGEYLITFEKA